MRELRHRPAQRLVKRDLLRRVGEMIVAANDVRDLHQRVVDHHHVVVNRNAAGAQDDGIADHFVGELDHAAHDVVKANGVLGNAQANGRSFAAGAAALRLRRIERPALAGIERRSLLGHLRPRDRAPAPPASRNSR